MGCWSHRRKDVEVRAEQKWDYINLRDFRVKGCGTPFAYGYLWFSLFLSIAFYAVDSFTAVNLLVFNRWSSEIEPAVSVGISKYIFSVCIIASFVNLGFEGVRASRVIRRGNIAECYLDNLAVRWESVRPGKGHGFRRFLVFAELTKSKKGTEYIALFTYFSLQSWVRVLLCAGPRQVVNAFTLRTVYKSSLLAAESDVGGSLGTFFGKLRELARADYLQVVILSGMFFTLVIWIFSLVFLVLAILFYVFFLWHWIPRADGGLTGYCERKVNKALLKIVTKTINKVIAKQESDRIKAEARAARKAGEKFTLERTATLPTIPDFATALDPGAPDYLLEMPTPASATTTTSSALPPYTSRPTSPVGGGFGGGGGGDYELGAMDQKRPIPYRTGTMTSVATTNFSSRASLVSAAADMGYFRTASPAPTLPSLDPPMRTATSSSMRSAMSRGPGPMPPPSVYSREYTESPVSENRFFGPPVRSSTAGSVGDGGYSRGPPFPAGGRQPPAPARVRYVRNDPHDGRSSPAPPMFPTRSAVRSPGPAFGAGPMFPPPQRSNTNPVPPHNPTYSLPSRNLTGSVPPPRMAPQPRFRAPDEDYDYGQHNRPPPPRQQPRARGENQAGLGSIRSDLEGQRDLRW